MKNPISFSRNGRPDVGKRSREGELTRLEPNFIEGGDVAMVDRAPLAQCKDIAVRAKRSTLRTESYFKERAARADIPKALVILVRAGKGNPPVPGDELLD